MKLNPIKELAILASIAAITLVAVLAYYAIKMVAKPQRPLLRAVLELGLGLLVIPVAYMAIFVLDDGVMRWIYLLTMALVGVTAQGVAIKVTRAKSNHKQKKKMPNEKQ